MTGGTPRGPSSRWSRKEIALAGLCVLMLVSGGYAALTHLGAPALPPPPHVTVAAGSVAPSASPASGGPASPSARPQPPSPSPAGAAAAPTRWLPTHVAAGAPPLRLPTEFTMATFNLLGASHTGPGGNQHPGWATGAQRMPAELRLLEEHGVAVAGVQEMQPEQLHVFESLAGTRWQHYPVDERDTQNALLWRSDVFTAVEGTTLAIPYFGGRIRRMPVVLLRQRSTGATAWFVNVHNPADIAASPHNAGWRVEAIRREVAAIGQLSGSGGFPVLLTGDLNDRALAFCPLTAGGLMHAASGGSGDPCSPPAHMGIDWIFGTAPVTFDGFGVDTTPLGGTSDHALVFTHVTF